VTSSSPPVSVIVRTRDSTATLGPVLDAIRAQTVHSEVIVVDSGSSDGTLQIARTRADLVIELPPAEFSYGRALNIGAAAASAPVHFALSSHSLPPDERWIERSLALYEHSAVAATNGARVPPGSNEPLRETFYQTLADAMEHPLWGFSNTGSSWRTNVWAAHPFDERLPACEDKEWGLRVLRAGWTIAFDPRLRVSAAHRTQCGARPLYERTRREFEALATFTALERATTAGFVREWLTGMPEPGGYRRLRRRLSYLRFAEVLGKHRGLAAIQRDARAPQPATPPT
jgi:glycosyltransferase involved in cell wall biosynthesis